jgi:hypothetical protein
VKLPTSFLVASRRDHHGIPPRQFTDRVLILRDRERLHIRRTSYRQCFPIQIEFWLLNPSIATEDSLDVVTVRIEHKCGVVIRPAQSGRSIFGSAGL